VRRSPTSLAREEDGWDASGRRDHWRLNVQTGAHSNITIALGGSTVRTGSEPVEAPRSKTRLFSEWTWLSVALGAGAAILALVFLVLPAAWWFWVGVPVAAFLAVGLILLMINPVSFYRRALSGWLFLGVGRATLGGAVELYTTQLPWINRLHWTTSTDTRPILAWVVIAIMLAGADIWSRRN